MSLPDFVTNNPAAFTAALRAVVQAALTFAVAFGVKVTPEQQTAILELGAALVTISLLVSAITVKTTVPKAPSPAAPLNAIQIPPS